MKESLWWHKPLRIIQYNLQMKDAHLMNAKKIAQETEEMSGNAVVINVADSVKWYQSQSQGQKLNPFLPKGRDLIQELLDELHKRDIKVIARITFRYFEEELYYKKPQWVMRNQDGSPVMVGNERPGEWHRLYAACPTSGFMMCAAEVSEEIFKKYDFDGCFGGPAPAEHECWCDSCKKLYYESFGEEMPDAPEKMRLEWRGTKSRKAAFALKETLLKVKLDMPIITYYWPFNLNMGTGFVVPADNLDQIAERGTLLATEAQDILSLGILGLHEWNTAALRMKMGRTVEDKPAPVCLVHTCPGMDWRHTCIPEAEFMYWAAQVPANGGSYWTSFTGFSDTIRDKRMLRAVGRLNKMMAKVEEDMYGAKSDCQVLLLSDGGVFVQGWAEALMCAHIDFDMLSNYQVSFERIKNYTVVIAPKNFRFDEASAELFTAYVEQGGRLIVEGTEDRQLSPVRALLGVEDTIISSEELEATYLQLEPAADEIQRAIGECNFIPLRGKIGFCSVSPEATVLATWVPAFTTAETAGFPPERASLPIAHTDVSLCAVRSCGKGKVMFLSYEPSRMIREYGLKDMFTMIEGYVIHMLEGDRRIVIKAPSRVMTTIFQKNNLHMIHFVNGIGQRPLQENIPCYNLGVSVALEGKTVEAVTSRIMGTEVEYTVEGDVLHITMSQLEVWDMLRIQYK